MFPCSALLHLRHARSTPTNSVLHSRVWTAVSSIRLECVLAEAAIRGCNNRLCDAVCRLNSRNHWSSRLDKQLGCIFCDIRP